MRHKVTSKSTQWPIKLSVTQQEFDTVLAALRSWRRSLATASLWNIGRVSEIATEHGEALTVEEIDDLIERIN